MKEKKRKMYFEEKDIPEGINFFNQEYSAPADVSAHLKKGDVVGFCTGSGGDFILKF